MYYLIKRLCWSNLHNQYTFVNLLQTLQIMYVNNEYQLFYYFTIHILMLKSPIVEKNIKIISLMR